jgi:hypothetical protein
MVTEGARETFADLRARWAGHEAELERLLDEQLRRFNVVVAESGVPAVAVPHP